MLQVIVKLVLVNSSSFGNVFDGKTNSINYYEYSQGYSDQHYDYDSGYYTIEGDYLLCGAQGRGNGVVDGNISKKIVKAVSWGAEEAKVDFNDLYNDDRNYFTCISSVKYNGSLSEYSVSSSITSSMFYGMYVQKSGFKRDSYSSKAYYDIIYLYSDTPWYKIKLKPCMVINEGNGTIGQPYEIDDSMC